MSSDLQCGSCASFGWLWLTDLHFGQFGQKWLWPQMREQFFDDVLRLHQECGPWDVVFFTGDLVFSGSKADFDRLTPIIAVHPAEARAILTLPQVHV